MELKRCEPTFCVCFDKANMMGNVIGDSLQQLGECLGTVAWMHTRTLKIASRQRLKDDVHLAADGIDDDELVLYRSISIRQPCGKHIGITADEAGLPFGDDSLHSIGIDDFEISDVADEFANRSSAFERMFIQLSPRDTVYRAPEKLFSGKILIDQKRVHRVITSTLLIESFGRDVLRGRHRGLAECP